MATAATPRTFIHVLEERNMRLYFGTQLISLTGLMLRSSLFALLILTILHGDREKAAPIIGWVWALGLLPGIFLASYAGMKLDAHDKRRVLYLTAVINMILAGVVALMSLRIDLIGIWQIYSIALLGGVVAIFDGVGRSSIIKEATLDQRNVQMGGMMFNAIYSIGMAFGNGLSGYLIRWIGFPGAFLVNLLSFGVLIWGLSQMDLTHVEPRKQQPKRSTRKVLAEGWNYVFAHRSLSTCIILSAFLSVFGFAYNVVLAV